MPNTVRNLLILAETGATLDTTQKEIFMRHFGRLLTIALGLPALALAANPTFTVVDLGISPGLNWAPVQPMVPNTGSGSGDSLGGGITYVYQQINGVGEVGESAIAGSYICSSSAATFHAFSAFVLETFRDLGTLSGGCQSAALALNVPRSVVGWSQRGIGVSSVDAAGGLKTAFVSYNGIMDALPSLLHPTTEEETVNNASSANAINNVGEIVGQAAQHLTAGGISQRAVLWENQFDPPLELQFQLGKASGTFIFTNAMGINCQGSIAVMGYPVNQSPTDVHSYLLVRQAPQNLCAE